MDKEVYRDDERPYPASTMDKAQLKCEFCPPTRAWMSRNIYFPIEAPNFAHTRQQFMEYLAHLVLMHPREVREAVKTVRALGEDHLHIHLAAQAATDSVASLLERSAAQYLTKDWPVCVCSVCIRCGCNESWKHHEALSECIEVNGKKMVTENEF